MARRPSQGGEILVCCAVPSDTAGVHAAIPAMLVEFKIDQREEYFGVAGQCLRIVACGRVAVGVRRVADMPDRFRGAVEGLKDDRP